MTISNYWQRVGRERCVEGAGGVGAQVAMCYSSPPNNRCCLLLAICLETGILSLCLVHKVKPVYLQWKERMVWERALRG